MQCLPRPNGIGCLSTMQVMYGGATFPKCTLLTALCDADACKGHQEVRGQNDPAGEGWHASCKAPGARSSI